MAINDRWERSGRVESRRFEARVLILGCIEGGEEVNAQIL